MGEVNAGYVDHIDTTNFSEAIKSIETMAKAMENIVDTLEGYKTNLVENWIGEGHDQFEVVYQIAKRKLIDLSEITWDMCENLKFAEDLLIQNDNNVADGIKMYGQ